MQIRKLTIAALVCLGLSASGVGASQETPQKEPLPGKREEVSVSTPTTVPPNTAPLVNLESSSVPELMIAGRVVMRLRSRAGGLTAEERAYNLRQRLGPILTLPELRAEDVEVRQRRPGQTASIFVRQRLLITVDRNLAKANNTSIEGLAIQWANNLRRALPQVNVAVRMSRGLPTDGEHTIPSSVSDQPPTAPVNPGTTP